MRTNRQHFVNNKPVDIKIWDGFAGESRDLRDLPARRQELQAFAWYIRACEIALNRVARGEHSRG
jgi:hypothetical protein